MTKATIETSKGTIEIELFADDAPGTVENFKKLADDGFYNGLAFHRVINNFMVQGGCPNTRDGASGAPGTGGPGYKIKCETKNNPHKHDGPGVLSMAHAGPNTGGSQFFITHAATPHLDGVHTVFGKVSTGQDIVDSIAQGDKITSITVS